MFIHKISKTIAKWNPWNYDDSIIIFAYDTWLIPQIGTSDKHLPCNYKSGLICSRSATSKWFADRSQPTVSTLTVCIPFALPHLLAYSGKRVLDQLVMLAFLVLGAVLLVDGQRFVAGQLLPCSEWMDTTSDIMFKPCHARISNTNSKTLWV